MAENDVLRNEAKRLIKESGDDTVNIQSAMEMLGRAQVYATLALDASVRELTSKLNVAEKSSSSITELVNEIEGGRWDDDLQALLESVSVRFSEIE